MVVLIRNDFITFWKKIVLSITTILMTKIKPILFLENIRNLIEKEQKATKIAEISFGGIEGKNSQKPSSEKPPASVELDPDKQHDDVGKDKSAKVQTPASGSVGMFESIWLRTFASFLVVRFFFFFFFTESVPVDSNQTLKTTNSSNAANVDSVSSRKSSSSSLAALPVVQTKETAKSSSDTAVSSSSTVVQTSAAAVTSTPAEVTTSTSVTTANRLSFPKTSFIPLSIKVPLTRCDSMIQPKQQPRINQVSCSKLSFLLSIPGICAAYSLCRALSQPN